MIIPPRFIQRACLLAFLILLAPGSGLVVAAADSAAAPRSVEIGILPYMPTAQLLTGHQGLRAHFEKQFRRPVALATATDFHAFQEKVLAGEFDFIVIGPGPGWQAHLDRNYEVVAMANRLIRIYVLVKKGASIGTLADLRGKALATIDPLTVTTQTTLLALRRSGIEPGRDIDVRYERTPFNCAQAVVLGEVAAAGFPSIAFGNLLPDIRDKLNVIYESEEIPGILYMVRPAPDMPDPGEFQAALLQFAETDAGRAYIEAFKHDGLSLPDQKVLRKLDHFVPEVRRLMEVR